VQRGGLQLGAGLLAGIAVIGVGSFVLRHADATTTTTSTTTSTSTTLAPPATTTTTIPVGDLPQTHALPPAVTRGLTKRMRALVAAVATGNPRLGYAAFFPLAAYLQTKDGWNNTLDWHDRLLGHFDEDVAALHASLGPNASKAKLAGYAVDDAAAVWVLPGEEENKGPYWRVYDTTVAYKIGDRRGYFTVTTMISWRGQWYLVHLTGFNS
jgi:hypothetical protein